MKRKIVVLCMLCMMVCTTACSKGEDTDSVVEHEIVSAKERGYDSLQELEDDSVLIVKGVRRSGEESIVTMVNDNPTTMYTLSEFEITEIYDDESGGYKVGDVITIYENAVYIESKNVIKHIAGYDMMVPGCEYLLFLGVAIEGEKPIYISGNYGTVSLENDNRYNIGKTRGGTVEVYIENCKPIWDDAKEKYIK